MKPIAHKEVVIKAPCSDLRTQFTVILLRIMFKILQSESRPNPPVSGAEAHLLLLSLPYLCARTNANYIIYHS